MCLCVAHAWLCCMEQGQRETEERVAGRTAKEADSKQMRKCSECPAKQLGSFVNAVEMK